MAKDEQSAPPPQHDGGRESKKLGPQDPAQPRETKKLPEGPNSSSASSAAAGAAAADAASKGDKLAEGAKSLKDQGTGVAGNVAKSGAQAAVAGKDGGKARQNLGRYAGAAAKGATEGAMKGGAHGAAAGAALETGKELGKDVKDDLKAGESSKIGRGVAVGSAGAAAPASAGLATIAFFIQWLKQLAMQAMAFVANLGNLIWSLIVAGAKAVASAIAAPFIAIGGFVANGVAAITGGAVSGAVAVGTSIMSGVTSVLMVGVLIVSGNVFNGPDKVGFLPDQRSVVCGPGGRSFLGSAGEDGVDPNVEMEDAARRVYSVLKHWGMPDENIAGILGNWSQESGIDPTSVQNFPVGLYKMTPEKESASTNTNNGIGLGQWTFGRNQMLRDFASDKGGDWWTIEMQLAFMAAGDNPSDVNVFKDMIRTSQGSPGKAARHFHDNWERSADNEAMMQERIVDAENWYSLMSGWEKDPSIIDVVEDIVGDILAEGGESIPWLKGGGECENSTGFSGSLAEGGMSEEDAAALIALYLEEGDAYLDDYFGVGAGPGTCQTGQYAGKHGTNCVSFSWYFLTKYTTYKGGYARGNGVDTARAMSGVTGIPLSDTPTPYSIFSTTTSSPAGHTGVVLRVEEDRIMVGQAGYCRSPGEVVWIPKSELESRHYDFLPLESILADDVGGGGSEGEPSGDGK